MAHACTVHAGSQRRACLALKIDRSTVRYTSTRPDDALLREAMKAVAAERRRFGYRRIPVMLDRQGIVMNQKTQRRLYREEKLQVRRRGDRKRAPGTRRPMLVPDRANARWSLDFLSDTISDGRRFRVLAIVNDYTRECLALVVDTLLSGHRVGRGGFHRRPSQPTYLKPGLLFGVVDEMDIEEAKERVLLADFEAYGQEPPRPRLVASENEGRRWQRTQVRRPSSTRRLPAIS